jgi:hypothetical protein
MIIEILLRVAVSLVMLLRVVVSLRTLLRRVPCATIFVVLRYKFCTCFNYYGLKLYTYCIPLTLYPRKGSRGISDIPPRHPRFTKIS